MIKPLEYWQNSHDYEARKVRALIIKWLEAGVDRHYNSEMEYLSAQETYIKATAVYGWRVGE